MKNLKKTLALLLSVIMIFGCMTAGMMASAVEVDGNYAYEVYDGEATIVKVNTYDLKDKVVIPSKLGGYPVTAIDDYAFEYCNYATEFVVPDSVEYISEDAFWGCDSVVKFDIGDGMSYLPYYILDSFENLEELVLGENVRIDSDDASIFFNPYECYDKLNITVSEDNPWLDVVDGVLYGEDMELLIYYPLSSAATSYEMPATVKGVYYPLYLAKNLQKIAYNDKFSIAEDFEGDYEMIEYLENVDLDAVMISQFISLIIPCNVAEITVNPAHPYLTAEDSVLYNKDKDLLIRYAPNRANTELTLHDDLVFLSTEALSGARNLELTITDGFTKNLNNFFKVLGEDEIDVVYAMEMFLSSSAAKSFEVADTNKYLKTENGVLYNKNMTDLIKYPIDSYGSYYELPATVGIEYMINLDDMHTGAFASLAGNTLFMDNSEYITASDLTVHVNEGSLDLALDAADDEEDIYEVIATAFLGVKEICLEEKIFNISAYNAMIDELIEMVEEAEEEFETYQEMIDAFKSLVADLEDESVDTKTALINYVNTAYELGMVDKEEAEETIAELDYMSEEELEYIREILPATIKSSIEELERMINDPEMKMEMGFMKALCVKAKLCEGEHLHEIIWRNAPVSIKTPSTVEIKHGETLILRAAFEEIPEGAKFVWSVTGDGVEIEPSEDGKSCSVKSVGKGNATVKLTVVDASGKAVKDENGEELGSSLEIKSNSNLWLRIVAFFKKLFGSNTTIENVYKMK